MIFALLCCKFQLTLTPAENAPTANFHGLINTGIQIKVRPGDSTKLKHDTPINLVVIGYRTEDR